MADWLDELSPDERTQWDSFVEHTRRETVEKIADSDVFVSLVPERGPDVKFAVELGFGIMLDKPLLAIVHPGAAVPAKLRAVADAIVEADLDTDAGRRAVAQAIADFKP